MIGGVQGGCYNGNVQGNTKNAFRKFKSKTNRQELTYFSQYC